VDRLEEDDLVRRTGDPGDRRVRLASLTTRGREAYAAALWILADNEGEFTRALGADRVADLSNVLRHLAQ